MARRNASGLTTILVGLTLVGVATHAAFSQSAGEGAAAAAHGNPGAVDYWPLLFVFALSTFIGIGVIARVSRLLHTPLMSITNAISAIAVVGSIIVTGSDYPTDIRILGAVALFASMTNIVSGFLITDRMLKMFKQEPKEGQKK
ncbi:MAG TPA: NAD(P) transhydrogenase subunit alpha [Candidatus Krumholzibacteria bacterium]|nr:NAD(P) transhydrogenase subunit alpha [Candidatus Krumholzibacteria bacterium]